MKRHPFCCASLTLFAALSMTAHSVSAQDLPDNWQQLPAAEFAAAVDKVYDEVSDRPVGNFDQDAVMEHAASLFTAVDLKQVPTTELPAVLSLFLAGKRKLEDTQVEAIRTALAARQDDWTGRPYEEMRSKVAMMLWIDMPFESYSPEARQWADAGGDISTVWDKDLHYYTYFTTPEPKIVRGSFDVRWEGRIIASKTGQYTFSISPINTSHVFREFSLSQTMKVTLNGQEIIEATPENWSTVANPVQLTAGQPVPLQVDLSVESPQLPINALHAMLSWEGPGISKTIVPMERLRLPATDDLGLRATYTWTDGGQPMSMVTVDHAIDFAWTSRELVLTSPSDSSRAVVWRQQMSSTYLDALAPPGEPVKLHPWTGDANEAARGLTSAQRQQFLEMLLTRPNLLHPLNARRAVDLYRAFRFGAAETALDVFGAWAAKNANCECEMPYEAHLPGIDLENREAYHEMAVAVTQDLPTHADRLQEEFLEMPDGSCCLPVAYVLGYSYLGRDKLNEWMELLDAKLAEETLKGDTRVNWLVARAHAYEIRLCSRNPFAIVKPRPMDGRYLLDTAMLAAEDPQLKLLVTKQIAARLAATRKFDEARALLDDAADSPPAGRAADIASWKASIDKFEADHAAVAAAHAEGAKQARVKKLQERRDKAAITGNTSAVSRYDALIQAADE